MPLRNPTKAEKRSYKEKLERAQGMDLEPKSEYEIKADKFSDPLSKECDEEIRLSGSKNQQYFNSYDKGLGSPVDHDDYSDESAP